MGRDFWKRSGVAWSGRARARREIDEELTLHLELRAQELIDTGMDPVEAWKRVAIRFGDLEYTRAYCLDRQRARARRAGLRAWVSATLRDLRFGIRHLTRHPAFSLAATLTLALGIGANTAAFSVVNSVLLEPLPYPDSHRIVRVWGTLPSKGEFHSNLSPPDVMDLASQASTLSALAAFAPEHLTVSASGEALSVAGAAVQPAFFRVLAVQPRLGRGFTEEEAVLGGPESVVLSHGFWETRLGADPDVVGRTLMVNRTPHTVVGVLPPGFVFPTLDPASRPALLRPLRIGPDSGRGGHWLRAVGRLAPGADPQGANVELAALGARLAALYPETNTGRSVRVETLMQATVGGSRSGLWILQGAVLLVLLIACTNVANLMLVRGGARGGELAVRRALGAGRTRLARQLLAESAALVAAGGALGLLLAVWATHVLAAAPGAGIPRIAEVGVDVRVLLVCAVTAVATGGVFSLVPLVQALRTDVRSALVGASGRGHGRSGRAGRWLVAGEAAVALILLAGAGLLMRSFANLVGEESGVDLRNTMVVEVTLPPDRYDTRTSIAAFYARWLPDLAELPGIDAAGGVNNIPFLYESCDGFRLEDRPEPPPGQGPCASNQLVTPGYFAAAGIAIVEGREFTGNDRNDSRPVIVVSETFADRFWPGESAVGKHVSYNGVSREVVGVSAAVRRLGLDRDAPPEMFIPHAQDAWETQMFVLVRSALDGDEAVRLARESLRAADPDVAVGRTLALRQLVSNTVAAPRFRTVVLGLFAILAVLLAVVGIYGVMAQSVARRRRELGLRLALGADRAHLRRLVVRDGLRIVVAGLGPGLLMTLAATRLMGGLLYEVGATDPLTLVGAATILCGAGLAGAYLPARRVTSLDPSRALRVE